MLKPAELTPLTAMRLGELALEAGLPEGLFEVITGSGSVVGQRFVSHPDVRKVVFTGSTEVGTDVAAGCARALKPVTLELGGKSANVIFADADLERAAASAPGAVFDNAGQDCCARSRILVQRSVFDRFLELLEPAVADWRVGDPHDEATEMGPLISAAHRDTVTPFIKHSRVAFRGSAPSGPGFWFAPAVVLPDSPQDRVAQHEIFGPVVAVLPFDDEADAIRLANDTIYGLAGSIWTENLGRAVRVARGVKSGVLSVNSHSSVRYTTPVRRDEGVRARPRARPRRRRALHRDRRTSSSRRMPRERHPRLFDPRRDPQGAPRNDRRPHPAPQGPRRRHHRRGERHRARHRAAVRRRGSPRRDRRPRPGDAARPRHPRSEVCTGT